MTTGGGKFDAANYLVNLKGKQYLEVKWRLVWLRSECPDATIATDLIRLDEGFAVFKAEVSLPNGGTATGYGSETVKDFGDFIEKAETKAIGRALGALGFGTQFTEDWDTHTADGDPNVVDSPVQRHGGGQEAQQPARSAAVPPRTAAGNLGNCPVHNAPWQASKRENGSPWHRLDGGGFCNKWDLEKAQREEATR